MKRISRKIIAQTAPPRSRAKPIMKANIAAARNPSNCIGAKSTGPPGVCQELRDGVDAAVARSSASATARTSRVPMITPSAISPTRRRLLRACRCRTRPRRGHRRRRLTAATIVRQLRAAAPALARHAGQGDDVGETDRAGGDLAEPLRRGRRRDEPDRRKAALEEGRATEGPRSRGRSGMIAPAAPAVGERSGEPLGAERRGRRSRRPSAGPGGARRRARRAPSRPRSGRRPRAPPLLPRGSAGRRQADRSTGRRARSGRRRCRRRRR